MELQAEQNLMASERLQPGMFRVVGCKTRRWEGREDFVSARNADLGCAANTEYRVHRSVVRNAPAQWPGSKQVIERPCSSANKGAA